MFEYNIFESYEKRKVGRDEINGFTISTVNTPNCGYETAISHEEFDNGNWIVVQYHSDKAEAAENHVKWCEKFTNKNVYELTSVQDYETYKRNI